MSADEKISPEMAALGETIRQLRDAKGLRVKDIAAHLGVTEGAVKNLQRGGGTQHFFRLAQICRLLGITPNELLGFNGAGDDDVALGALEVSYIDLGLPEAEARLYAQAVLEAIKAPPIQSVVLQPRDHGRAKAEIALRKLARPK